MQHGRRPGYLKKKGTHHLVRYCLPTTNNQLKIFVYGKFFLHLSSRKPIERRGKFKSLNTDMPANYTQNCLDEGRILLVEIAALSYSRLWYVSPTRPFASSYIFRRSRITI